MSYNDDTLNHYGISKQAFDASIKKVAGSDEDTASSFAADAIMGDMHSGRGKIPAYEKAWEKARGFRDLERAVKKLHERKPIKGLRDPEDYNEYSSSAEKEFEEEEGYGPIDLIDWNRLYRKLEDVRDRRIDEMRRSGSYNQDTLNHYGIEKTSANDLVVVYEVFQHSSDEALVSIRAEAKTEVSGERPDKLGDLLKLQAGQLDSVSRKALDGFEQEIIGAFQGVKTKTKYEKHYQTRVLGVGLQILGYHSLSLKQDARNKAWTNPKAEVEELLERVARKYKVIKGRV